MVQLYNPGSPRTFPGPLYSFSYPATLSSPPAIVYTSFFATRFIENPVFEAEYDIWGVDFKENYPTLIPSRPAGLVMVTCQESLDDGTFVLVWYCW